MILIDRKEYKDVGSLLLVIGDRLRKKHPDLSKNVDVFTKVEACIEYINLLIDDDYASYMYDIVYREPRLR